MADEIVNKVAQSGLITFDMGTLYPPGNRQVIDIATWLDEGIVLREKRFRESVKNHHWEQYNDAYIALHCSTDAIIPQWAWMLISTELAPYARDVVIGNREVLETALIQRKIQGLDVNVYRDARVIIAGCSEFPVPASAYAQLAIRLQPLVKSLFYGEACSSVPLFKRK